MNIRPGFSRLESLLKYDNSMMFLPLLIITFSILVAAIHVPVLFDFYTLKVLEHRARLSYAQWALTLTAPMATWL